MRPSDSSVENDSIGLVLYTQRFSKIPTEILNSQKQKNIVSNITAPPRPPKRISGLVLDGIEYRNKDTQSDTENASPAIGPKEVNSVSIMTICIYYLYFCNYFFLLFKF